MWDKVAESATQEPCPQCKKMTKYCSVRFNPRKNSKKHYGLESPRWSDALGINPDQEVEFHAAFPNLDLTFDKEGRCLVKNWQHQKQIMKARGFDSF
jgi:hypothetical protein